MAIAACFWSHWRRQRLRKKADELKLGMEQTQRNQLLFEKEQEDQNKNEINENERRIIIQEVIV